MMDRRTVFSDDRRYRYTLWRVWDLFNPNALMVIGLNPSTADECRDDPTVRRCIGFAKTFGFGALCMMNLFAFRATDPKAMKSEIFSPQEAANDSWLLHCADEANEGVTKIVCAWGVHGQWRDRDSAVEKLLSGNDLYCLGLTQAGYPRHPLYVKGDTKLQAYRRQKLRFHLEEGVEGKQTWTI